MNGIWTKTFGQVFTCLISLLLHAQQTPSQQKTDESGFNCCWYQTWFKTSPACLFAHSRECMCEAYCSWRHTLAPFLRLPQIRAPSPFLLYLLTTATTNIQAGRRLTHLDYPPPPTSLPSLFALLCLHRHSSPGRLTHWRSHFLSLSPLHIQTKIFLLSFRLVSDRWLFAVVFMFEQFLTYKKKELFSLVNIWPEPSLIQLVL